MAFKTETQVTLRPGERATIRSPYGWTYRLTHLGISQYDALNRQVTAATLEVERDGKRLGVLTTEKRQHVDGLGRPTFQPDRKSTRLNSSHLVISYAVFCLKKKKKKEKG